MNSKDKGKRGERFAAQWLRDNFGLEARRGCQFSGGQDSPDVVGGFNGTHCEVKYVEKLNLEKAMQQAVGDRGNNIPYVFHKRNRHDPLITVRASDLLRFAKIVVDQATIIKGGVYE